jgi:hypothetical protein
MLIIGRCQGCHVEDTVASDSGLADGWGEVLVTVSRTITAIARGVIASHFKACHRHQSGDHPVYGASIDGLFS